MLMASWSLTTILPVLHTSRSQRQATERSACSGERGSSPAPLIACLAWYHTVAFLLSQDNWRRCAIHATVYPRVACAGMRCSLSCRLYRIQDTPLAVDVKLAKEQLAHIKKVALEDGNEVRAHVLAGWGGLCSGGVCVVQDCCVGLHVEVGAWGSVFAHVCCSALTVLPGATLTTSACNAPASFHAFVHTLNAQTCVRRRRPCKGCCQWLATCSPAAACGCAALMQTTGATTMCMTSTTLTSEWVLCCLVDGQVGWLDVSAACSANGPCWLR